MFQTVNELQKNELLRVGARKVATLVCMAIYNVELRKVKKCALRQVNESANSSEI